MFLHQVPHLNSVCSLVKKFSEAQATLVKRWSLENEFTVGTVDK